MTQKKHHVYNVWSNNIQSSVREINQQLSDISSTVDGLVPLVNELNQALSVDERMAPFSRSDELP